MKLLTIVITLLISSASLASSECTISKRNGGLVIEKQSSKRIVKKMYGESLEFVIENMESLIENEVCASSRPVTCGLTKRNGGFVIEDTDTRRLISNFQELSNDSIRDLSLLSASGICEKSVEISCDITKRNGGFAIENTKTRSLLSHLRATADASLRDLSELRESEVCQ